jgi:hypothetical protein
MSYSLVSWREHTPRRIAGAIEALEGCVAMRRQGDRYDLQDDVGRPLGMTDLLEPAYAEAAEPAAQRRLVGVLADYLDLERDAAAQRVDVTADFGRRAWREAGVTWGFNLNANVPQSVTNELAARHGDAFSVVELLRGVEDGADRLAGARWAQQDSRARDRRAAEQASAPPNLRNPTINDVANIDWRTAPLDDRHRTLAGQARDLPEFYSSTFSRLAQHVEAYLERYSRETTHADLDPTPVAQRPLGPNEEALQSRAAGVGTDVAEEDVARARARALRAERVAGAGDADDPKRHAASPPAPGRRP